MNVDHAGSLTGVTSGSVLVITPIGAVDASCEFTREVLQNLERAVSQDDHP